MQAQPTRYPSLGYWQAAPNLWRIVDRESGAEIGAHYRTKAELLADLENVARSYGEPTAAAAPDTTAELARLREQRDELVAALEGMVARFWGDTRERERENFRRDYPEHSVVRSEAALAKAAGDAT